MGKIGMPQQMMQPDDAGQQYRPAKQRINQIGRTTTHGCCCAAMNDQREGGEGQQFIKNEKGKQVGSHSDAHGSRDAKAEKTEKTAAARCALKVTDRIKCSEQPEHGR